MLIEVSRLCIRKTTFFTYVVKPGCLLLKTWTFKLRMKWQVWTLHLTSLCYYSPVRFMALIGQVALCQVIYLEGDVLNDLKQKRQRKTKVTNMASIAADTVLSAVHQRVIQWCVLSLYLLLFDWVTQVWVQVLSSSSSIIVLEPSQLRWLGLKESSTVKTLVNYG